LSSLDPIVRFLEHGRDVECYTIVITGCNIFKTSYDAHEGTSTPQNNGTSIICELAHVEASSYMQQQLFALKPSTTTSALIKTAVVYYALVSNELIDVVQELTDPAASCSQ
jgi:hypothetical protein